MTEEAGEKQDPADSLNFQDNTKTEVFSFPPRYNGRTEKFGNLPTAQSGVKMGSDARQSDTVVSMVSWSCLLPHGIQVSPRKHVGGRVRETCGEGPLVLGNPTSCV